MKRGCAFGQNRTLRWLTDFGPSDANILYADTRFRIRRIRASRRHSTRRLRNVSECRYAFHPDVDTTVPTKRRKASGRHTTVADRHRASWRVLSRRWHKNPNKAKTILGTPHDTTLVPDADRRFRKCEWQPRNDTRHDAGNSTPSVGRWSVVNVSLSQSNPT
jgi:hypothetical protein